MRTIHFVKMDAKIVILFAIVFMSVSSIGESKVVFNFHDKLRMASTTPRTKIKNSQMIRMPELSCGDGARRDRLGICREKF